MNPRDSKQILPISVFGWTGTMSIAERKVCEFSIMYDPSGDTVVQFLKPMDTRENRTKGINVFVRVRKKHARGKGWSFTTYEFGMKKDGTIVILPERDPEEPEKVETQDIPHNIALDAHATLEKWFGIKHNEVERQLLDQFFNESGDKFQFERLAIYIKTLGRRHGRNTSAVHMQGDRRIAPELRQRSVDKASLGTDVPGGGEAISAPEWD